VIIRRSPRRVRETGGWLALSLLLFGIATQLPPGGQIDTGSGRVTGEASDGAAASMPVLGLRVAMRDYMLLDTLRLEAIERGLLFRSSNDMVSALVTIDGRHQRAQVRLKGDFADHFASEKWSWRLHMAGDSQVLGLRRFSLQAPGTRRFQLEALLFSHMRSEGLIAPRYEFVNLWVNGRDHGVMALEEHFSKELLEAQGRREGVIVRFDEDDFWRDRSRNDSILGVGRVAPGRDLSWRSARVRPFRQKVISKSPALEKQAAAAVGMLKALQQDSVAPSSIFDVDQMGRFLALSEIWGYWHGLRWHNMRFYLNPLTFRLEPVAFDATSRKPSGRSLFSEPVLIFTRVLLADEQIYAAYRSELARLLESDPLDGVAMGASITRLVQEETRLLDQLQVEYDVSAKAGKHLTRRARRLAAGEIAIPTRQQIVDTALTGRESGPVLGELPYPVAVHANLVQADGDGAVLELSTMLKEEVHVEELMIGAGVVSTPLMEVTDVELPLRLVASSFDRPAQPVRVPVPRSLFDDPSLLTGRASVPSQRDHRFTFSGQRDFPAVSESPLPERADLQELLARFPFLSWNGDSFEISAGVWQVPEPLIIPRQLDLPGGDRPVRQPALLIEAGVELQFGPDAFLASHGACIAQGTAVQPIILRGQEDATWRGLAVLGARRPSLLEHVRIERADATGSGAWQLTGGVTFYGTQVTLDEVTIVGSQAEDGLNIVSSTFALRGVQLRASRSDALDIDFSRGSILASGFDTVGGDAIDLSGSQVTGSNIRVATVRDKGVSVGEKSSLEVDGIWLMQVGAGIVSKDLSEALVSDVHLQEVGYAAFMAYSKKAEYGPGTVIATDVDFDGSARPGVVQYGSLVRIDGVELTASHLDVDLLYTTAHMRK